MNSEITHLHHVGHVVRDMAAALDYYGRLGFTLAAPAYPVLSPAENAPPRPFGVANCHASFGRNFIEIVACIADGEAPPAAARLVPLQAPPQALPRLLEMLTRTTDKLKACLARFQGLHILVFSTADAAGSAARLSAAGVSHSGAGAVQRPADGAAAPKQSIRFLEIDEAGAAEGRLALAEPTAEAPADHPNGAYDLEESILCVAAEQLDPVVVRYQHYLGCEAQAVDGGCVFQLQDSRLSILTPAALARLLPGVAPPPLPGFAAYAVRVRDLAATQACLERNGIRLRANTAGDLYVPAAAALGAGVIFRQ
jgi:catechol 2,3-dioxygenase-like lactoylglutathione lyase family enzyme